MIINERYIMKAGSYVADITNADFITMRKSENGVMLKLHFGTKEIRYECKLEVAESIFTTWSKFRGEMVNFEEIDILGDINGYY
tara:strand:+ start:79 stop:330 length:252 start_codon:yes stop_codon:yes gene_type:complete